MSFQRPALTRRLWALGAVGLAVVAVSVLTCEWGESRERLRYELGETELVVSNAAGAAVTLFRAAEDLDGAVEVPDFDGESIWLPRGNYFVRADLGRRALFYPVPIVGYRAGPDEDGTFTLTVRPPAAEPPPRLLPDLPEFAYIPSGHFLLGDR
jgi:hypothetical protein